MSPPLPVLVIGAGPVGLAAATELARLGASVRIVERRAARSPESRAIGVNPRTLALLEACGATEALVRAGVRLRGMRIVAGGRTAAQIDLRRIDPRYPFMLALPQSETERILEERLEAHGVRVERGIEAGEVSPDPDGVTVDLGGGSERFAWVVGADGAHSGVRKAIGATFPGERYPFDWSLADIDLAGTVEEDRGEIRLERGRPILFRLPIGPGRHRLISNGPALLESLPAGWRRGTVHWESRFSVSHRLADRIHHDRAVIIGDAAHIHSPAGGRGMNLGIEDAATLAPRLLAGDLGDWPAGRRARAQAVVRESDRIQTLATTDTLFTRRILPGLIGLALRTPSVNDILARRIVGVGG